MKAASFTYHRPTSLDDAVRILSEVSNEDGRVIAGGQSLVPMMAYRIATPAHLVDINRIDELKTLKIEPKQLSISSCVRHAAFEDIAAPGPTGAMLRAIVAHVAHHPIRVRGTFCGSLAHSDPASEWCLLAATMDAVLIAKSVDGDREIPAVEYFEGIMTTALRSDELLAQARLPCLAPDARFAFQEFSRRAGDFAIASILATGRIEGGALCDLRIGVGGAEGTPRRLRNVEEHLEGKPPSQDLFREVAVMAADTLEPLEDSANSADYRRDLVRALLRRCLERAFAYP